MKSNSVSVSRGRWFIGFVVIVAAAAGLAGCVEPLTDAQVAAAIEQCDKRGGRASLFQSAIVSRVDCDWPAAYSAEAALDETFRQLTRDLQEMSKRLEGK